ncbi:hypothetical protein [Corynebacterium casei]|uniref:Uncharacterized protein n=1 Tax=Corynebacterium casei UCMA 3821 TaxID=1110505 RepID=G7HV43_9CORY|nr:putative uncharacterized protein [Corynebacterium casei UCMA 3821]
MVNNQSGWGFFVVLFELDHGDAVAAYMPKVVSGGVSGWDV